MLAEPVMLSFRMAAPRKDPRRLVLSSVGGLSVRSGCSARGRYSPSDARMRSRLLLRLTALGRLLLLLPEPELPMLERLLNAELRLDLENLFLSRLERRRPELRGCCPGGVRSSRP